MHIGLGNVFDYHRDIVFPSTHRFVVRGGDEAPVAVYKGNGIDCTQMLIVFLCDAASVTVELDDFLVGVAGQKDILLGRVEGDAVRDLTGRE